MSSQSRYSKMFQSSVFTTENNNFREAIANEIKWARSVLKKDDKIVWYLKLVKYLVLTHDINKYSAPSSKESAWMANYEKSEAVPFSVIHENNKRFNENQKSYSLDDDDFLTSVKTRLVHYQDMNLHKINNICFANKSWDSILGEMNEIEEAWQNRLSDRSVEEYGVPVLHLSNGLVWFDLQRSGCRIEGNAMGHCGNGSGYYNQNVYSLRRKDPEREGYWIPHVTLIMNDKKNGITGEIKGFGNEKPAEKYWSSIVEFLKSDLVSSMQGGGYKPENNFSLSDLPEKELKDLFSVKPSLFDTYTTWLMNDKKVTEQVIDKYQNEYPGNIEYSSSKNDGKIHVCLEYGSDIEDLAETFNLKNLAYYSEGLKDGSSFLDNDNDSLVHYEDQIEEALSEIIKDPKNEVMFDSLRAYLETEYAETIFENELNINNPSDIINLYKETDDEKLDSIFNTAVRYAVSSGCEAELFKAVSAVESSLAAQIEGGELQLPCFDSEWRYIIPLQSLFELYEKAVVFNNENYSSQEAEVNIIDVAKTYFTDEEQFSFEDLEVPYYGFSGFDDEVLKTTIAEQIYEELHEEIEIRKSAVKKNNELPEVINPLSQITNKKAIEHFIERKTNDLTVSL